MSAKLDLLKDKESALLWKYMIPSVGGMLGLSVCIFFDTMFIGRRLGEIGLASLNIAVPLFNLYYAVAMTFGVGGATALSIAIGQKKKHKINAIFTSSLIGALAVIIILNIVGYFFIDNICYLLGASAETFPYVKDYIKVILNWNAIFIISNILNVFVRSDKAPKLSMMSIIVTNIANIMLDYLFIYPLNMGMEGAALATTIAQGIGVLVLFIHFFGENNSLHIEFKAVKAKKIIEIISNGMPSFVTELSAGFVIIIFNNIILSIGGNVAVSAYGIIANVALIFLAVFNGISQGMQPLVSINHGAGESQRVNTLFRISFRISLIIGVVFCLIGVLLPNQIIAIFTSQTGEFVNITVNGMRIYFISFILMGANIVGIAYLQAMQKNKSSFILSTFRGLILTIVLVIILSKLFGLTGVWMTIPIVELITFAAFLILKQKNKKQK
ncbi:MATE family efflux transporter [uncultured Clostridium sp.]|jgi:putative MATE family efflux protein|uniref:MATE family efflux transporter n=1 Tax=uncultured Clostridium sp. TaxID=59620 RepID=UPI00262F5BF4|nr:MATE family efflux transporter [uncultured Clostridium sp.]